MKIRCRSLATFFLCAFSAITSAQQTGKWGDQGDGTFRNPIIAGDYSDPDVIRVGSDYFLVTSTFQESPGLVLLRSKDLINWTTLGAAMPDLTKVGPDFNWDRMNRYNGGIYAPAIRFHAGKFWIFVNSFSGEGFWVCTATDPAGPWTVTQIKDKNGKPLRTGHWTDPCPFWDDDGRAYLASSRPGGEWFGYLFEMKPDGTQLLDADVDKMNVENVKYAYPEGGTLYSPYQSTEGNKIYKRNGYYYLLHIEFLNTGNGIGTYILRSKNIYGIKPDGTPGKRGDAGKYELLKFGSDVPGQGAFVNTPDDRWFWIGQFNQTESDGRKPHLLPVTWIDDWPVPGAAPDHGKKQGQMIWQMKKPIAGQPVAMPQGSDEFSKPTLDPQWTWSHQPRGDYWSLTARPGFLRLSAFKPGASRFSKIGNVISQRNLRSEKTVITTLFEIAGMTEGQEAGLAHFNGGKNYASLSLVRKAGTFALKYETDGQAEPGPELPNEQKKIWLRVTTTFDNQATFQYSFDGHTFQPTGGSYTVKGGNYRGDRVGLYTVNPQAEAGYVDVDFFHYEIENR